jgi:activator of HSP90 ATPase
MMTQDAGSASTNWKNVNNWHWVEKNCLPWTREFLGQKLKEFNVEQDGQSVEIIKVKSIDGDIDLNQRKGKLINIYDLSFKLEWKGTKVGMEDAVKGELSVPEWMHDSDELEWSATVESELPGFDSFLSLVKKKLCPTIEEYLLKNFSKDLLAAHSKDVVIPKENMQGHPTLKSYTPKPPVESSIEKPSVEKVTAKEVKGALITLHQTIEFMCSAADLYDVLVNPGKVAVWSRGSQIPMPVVDGPFCLFNDNVSGTWKTLKTPSEGVPQLVFTWRLDAWPKDHTSLVTLDFEQGSDSTQLKLTQEGVPIGIKELTSRNWHNYYWNAIKGTFGYGAQF